MTPRRLEALMRPFRALARVDRRRLAGIAMLVAGLAAMGPVLAPSRSFGTSTQPASVTALMKDISAGRVAAVRVDDVGHVAIATYGAPQLRNGRRVTGIEVAVPETYERDVVAALVRRGVPVTTADSAVADVPGRVGGDHGLVLMLASTTATIGMILLLRRRRTGSSEGSAPAGVFGLGRRRVEPAEVPDVRFGDVAGCDEAIADLQELVAFLREPDRFARTGAKAPKGALLVGPPGTGKTLLARAVAGEAGVAFFAVSGSDFVEKFVGVGATRVRNLFASARACGRAIIFIDEIDAVARRRGGGDSGSHAESENTLIALLTQMDGFAESNVVVLAATNRPDILDPAVTRPGRLDRKVEVPNPDRRGRERILSVHLAGKPVTGSVDLTRLARRTPGFSGAQLAALVNEACVEAVRRDLDVVTGECFDAAVATIALGRARTSALVTDNDRRVTAWHEAGHTLAAYLLPDADDPVQVTIVPRGPAGGVTWMSGSDDSFLPRRKAHAQLVVALAGRAAEEVLLDGEFTQGASGDLQSATELAYRMATQYGMTRLGYQVRDITAESREAAEVVDELLAQAHVTATALLASHRTFLAAVAEALLDEETLTLADVAVIADRCRVTGPFDVVVPLPARAPRTPSATPTALPTSGRPPAESGPPSPRNPQPCGAGAVVGIPRQRRSRARRRTPAGAVVALWRASRRSGTGPALG